jgi:hypothetical protein
MKEVAPRRATIADRECVHPYVLQWSGKCEGCRLTPLPPAQAELDQRKPADAA